MALPSPLPDDPRKWDGWSRYDSENRYERLCLAFEENPSDSLIEENCRQLLVWWQKKLPLKNQPSNPIAQLLRGGMDAAPAKLAEARADLLNPEVRAKLDVDLAARHKAASLAEFLRFLDFALGKGVLSLEEENHLFRMGRTKGLNTEEMRAAIDEGLIRTGAKRQSDLPPPPAPVEPSPAAGDAQAGSGANGRRVRRERNTADPTVEFLRMLRLSGLDEDAMTDDQRDAFINMAENLGLDPGDAEDIVDEYLDEMSEKSSLNLPPTPSTPILSAPRAGVSSTSSTLRPITTRVPSTAMTVRRSPHGGVATAMEELSPMEERVRFPNFQNMLGMNMLIIPSTTFTMGSAAPDAPANERPQMRVTLTRYYISRYPITNDQYEVFDAVRKARRGGKPHPLGNHPVTSVSSVEAIKFCQWLSQRDGRRYRLPTEAEWEYAAKGAENRLFPWGTTTGQGNLANFADKNTRFLWSDFNIDDGWAETSPVGAYPLGASPFGVEDMAGNVWEWCLDYFEPYRAQDRMNPRGPSHGAQRVYRGGSWKSRFGSLKTTSRGFNQPSYASNDVGFRVVCECGEPVPQT